MECPECSEHVSQNQRGCPCGWVKGSVQGRGGQYRAPNIPPEGTVPCNIGGRITWVKSCYFETKGKKCQWVGSCGGLCRWHTEVINSPEMNTREEFLDWCAIHEIELPEKCWNIVRGHGRWLEAGEL